MKDLIGKRARLRVSELKWYLEDDAFQMFVRPGSLEAEPEYDLSVENCLLMALFRDEYPATITMKSGGNYRLVFDNGREAWFGREHIEVEK